jgi:hypothetical protein
MATSPTDRQNNKNEFYDLPPVPDDLIKACLADECVLYTGAGVSADIKALKDLIWEPFITKLLKWAEDAGYLDSTFAATLREALNERSADSVADSIVSAVTDIDALINFLRGLFLVPVSILPKRYSLLRSIPFCAALTTNFDDLLERNYKKEVGRRVFAPQDAQQLLGALSAQEFFILKLYGTLARSDTVIISPAQFQAAVSDNPIFSQFMQSLFISRTLLFVGASLNNIWAYLSGLRFRTDSSLRQHYALVDVPPDSTSTWKVRADQLKRRYGINILPFTVRRNYAEVDEFLQNVGEKVKQARAARAASSSVKATETTRQTSWLRRVELENIGPFETQSFDFKPNWNVLLGDNGVGKSTILKAIAVALMGEDAKPFADRIIREKKPSATITLEIASGVKGAQETRKYVTKLIRTQTGCEVTSTPTRPLEVVNLLALAFPPLRMMGWERGDREAAGAILDQEIENSILREWQTGEMEYFVMADTVIRVWRKKGYRAVVKVDLAVTEQRIKDALKMLAQ